MVAYPGDYRLVCVDGDLRRRYKWDRCPYPHILRIAYPVQSQTVNRGKKKAVYDVHGELLPEYWRLPRVMGTGYE